MQRRLFLIAGGCALALPAAALAQEYAIDWQGQPPDPAVAARLAKQIAMVKALPIRPDVLAFFARQPIFVTETEDGRSHAGNGPGVFITRKPFPDDNPVLLHELIHRWHFQTLANTPRVQPLRDLFAAEKASPHWPAQAYMYTNISEFLAMVGSVVLHGRAARPPFTREQVATKTPALYRWVVNEFGYRG